MDCAAFSASCWCEESKMLISKQRRRLFVRDLLGVKISQHFHLSLSPCFQLLWLDLDVTCVTGEISWWVQFLRREVWNSKMSLTHILWQTAALQLLRMEQLSSSASMSRLTWKWVDYNADKGNFLDHFRKICTQK